MLLNSIVYRLTENKKNFTQCHCYIQYHFPGLLWHKLRQLLCRWKVGYTYLVWQRGGWTRLEVSGGVCQISHCPGRGTCYHHSNEQDGHWIPELHWHFHPVSSASVWCSQPAHNDGQSKKHQSENVLWWMMFFSRWQVENAKLLNHRSMQVTHKSHYFTNKIMLWSMVQYPCTLQPTRYPQQTGCSHGNSCIDCTAANHTLAEALCNKHSAHISESTRSAWLKKSKEKEGRSVTRPRIWLKYQHLSYY